MILQLITTLCILQLSLPTYSLDPVFPRDVPLTEQNKRVDPIPMTLRQTTRRARQINYCVNLLNNNGMYYPQSQVFPGAPEKQYPPFASNQYPVNSAYPANYQYPGYPYPSPSQLGPAYAPPSVKQCSQRASTPDATFSRSCYDPKEQSGHDVCKFYIEGAIYTGKDPYQAGCPAGTVGYCCCDPKIGTCDNIV
ncbi:Telomerase-binding protein EST1A [Folsomia candida]|uniref:Telomerase-binding protein EST1A n=1 Tax=Folsomia candida TaxID=158441 RepID=A0A226D1C7_FOLCA|nr:Telomerase-binding protein EST1A [Folsomia candida]